MKTWMSGTNLEWPKPDMETTLYGSAYGSTETDKTNL